MRTREDTPLEDPTGPVIGCLHHLAPPMPGAAAAALRGARLDHRHLRDGDPLPDLDEVDGIVSFGGDQSVLELERYPYLVEEVAFLRAAVERDVPVLGICLGAQLLAHALGGSVRRLPTRAVTWARLAHTPAAARDPLVSALPDPVPALHWNEDAIEPPPGAEELLDRGGLGCAAFRLGSACGVQFHPDVDGATLDGWYAAYGDWLAAAGVDEADARATDARHLPGQAAVADALFGGFAELTSARAAPGRAVR
jgi:GMP synthase (glutamine-hydrolysing)